MYGDMHGQGIKVVSQKILLIYVWPNPIDIMTAKEARQQNIDLNLSPLLLLGTFCREALEL